MEYGVTWQHALSLYLTQLPLHFHLYLSACVFHLLALCLTHFTEFTNLFNAILT